MTTKKEVATLKARVPASYPIRAVARLTGIPLDTLRAWERRYQAVTPKRVSRGRLYSEVQVQRLLLLREAVDKGHSIGQASKLKDRQLKELLHPNPPGNKEESAESQASLLPVLRALDRFDYAATDREINRLATAMANPRDFVHLAALPLMRIVGESWHQGKCSLAQEHMLANLLSALLASMVRIYSPFRPSKRVLLATPSGEHHAFPNLAAAMLTAVGGLGVVYLGTDLPADDIVLAARKSGADVVLLSLSTTPNAATLAQLHQLARKSPRSSTLWLGCSSALGLEKAIANSRWVVLHDFLALEYQLTALGARF